jgi:putative acetyltransferase
MLSIKSIIKESPELDIIRKLFADYQQELNEDLCFQSFAELKDPLKKYEPGKGIVLLAYWNGEVAGCVALHHLDDASCEMKRLYVKPEYRKHKIGETLSLHLLNEARKLGFAIMKLDTLLKLQPAISLYRKLGFSETAAYYSNPITGVVYLQKKL